ncbi:hypothetical protein CHELA1G11_20841 [Hyphomicrobiales bacterium]|nr:hypothetical protein CHELA1G11_20841 [Hyphomicrobiales bacterium]CAH1692208.1 hypothetical protein CHELA1G2_21157 [Hyphomicrobiales bacterium]
MSNTSLAWPAAGFVDAQLSESHLLFELDRAKIADGRVPADRVVEPLDVVELLISTES